MAEEFTVRVNNSEALDSKRAASHGNVQIMNENDMPLITHNPDDVRK